MSGMSGMQSAEHYLAQVRQALEPLADAQAARQMRAYMRDQFPFLGLSAPLRRQAVAALGRPAFGAEALLQAAEALWSLPQREYRYTAVDLLARHARQLELSCVPALLALALREPWWDTVDGLAGVVGDVLRQARRTQPHAQGLMDEALHAPSFWTRRIALLHQLGWRLETDSERLFRYAATLAPEEAFFIRKAIGWALRDYARWNPQAVRGFVAEHRSRLSALSVSEAMKHLKPAGPGWAPRA
jgi:3-methyladenine DNA glycosylase AlkD